MKNNFLDKILSENNNENLIISDEQGNKMEFEQVAVINLDDTLYALLHPLHMGYAKDEAIAYRIMQNDSTFELLEVEDENLLKEIDEQYIKLLKNSKK